MDDNMTILIEDQAGQRRRCDVLFTFDNGETGKSYIVYTDNSTGAGGRINVSASVWHPDDPSSPLEPIETEEEWAVIEQMMDNMTSSIRQAAEEGRELTEEEIIAALEDAQEDDGGEDGD